MAESLTLVDSIYEAAVISETWPSVLNGLSQSYQGAGGVLFAFGANGSQNWVASPDIRGLLEEFIGSGQGPTNPRPARLAAMDYEGFANDLDVFTPEEIDQDKFYTDFLAPRGLGWTAATMVRVPSGDTLAFSIDRAFKKGPFEDHELLALDALRPHLARAALLSARLDLKRAEAMTQALAAIGLPGAVLSNDGKLYTANGPFESLLPAVLQDRNSRIAITNKAADVLLADAIARLAVKGADKQSCSIPVPGREGVSPMIVHVLPVRGAAHDIFSRSLALLIVTPVDRTAVPTAEVLQGLFDLTPTEARVARAISMSKSVNDIAALHGVSRETIRTHLYSVLEKTGVNRQAALVALLSGNFVLQDGGF